MRKTIMFMSVFAFAFAITAVAASAGYCPGCWWGSSVDVDNCNSATVVNDVDASANTGYNGGGVAIVETGNADALATAYTDVNHNYTKVDGAPYRAGRVEVNNGNSMRVTNDVDANANTGYNGGFFAGVKTGDADAVAVSETIGNTNYTEVDRASRRVSVNNYNSAMVENDVTANANTGYNGGCLVRVDTGNADSVAQSITIVNSNVTKIK